MTKFYSWPVLLIF